MFFKYAMTSIAFINDNTVAHITRFVEIKCGLVHSAQSIFQNKSFSDDHVKNY